MKFLATVDCLDVKTKTTNVLRKTLLDLRCWTLFQDDGYISGVSAAQWAAKRIRITIGTEPHACMEIETHTTLFSWSTRLAAWIAGTSARRRRREHGGHTPANTKSWFTAYAFDIWHPCYGQLTPVKTRYALTSITLPYSGLMWGHVFF